MIRRALANEQGSTLPEVMVAVVISALGVGVVATAIISATHNQQNLTEDGKITSSRVVAEGMWRSDVSHATAIAQTSPTDVRMLSEAPGTCSESAWEFDKASSTLTNTLTQYDGPLAGGRCTGTASAPTKTAVLSDLPATTAITFRNTGGRPLTFQPGAPILGVGGQPATVSAELWNSTQIGTVTLTTETGSGTAKARDLRIAELAAGIPKVGN